MIKNCFLTNKEITYSILTQKKVHFRKKNINFTNNSKLN